MFVSQTRPVCSLDGASGALRIINTERDPVGIPEVELVEVPLKMPLSAMLVDARPCRA